MKDKMTQASDSHPFVAFPTNIVPVRLVRRLNRFALQAEDDKGSSMLLHLPNSGRMNELLTPGTLGMASLTDDPTRKTVGSLLLVQYENRWVSVDARMPNRLFDACLAVRFLTSFCGYDRWQSEVSWGKGRIDFRLSGQNKPDFLVETKSCNLVENGIALFPDAPTERGTRHLTELTQAVGDGYRAAVVWYVQRDDPSCLKPHDVADPAFAEALKKAVAAGVEAYAYRCQVSPAGIRVLDELKVVL